MKPKTLDERIAALVEAAESACQWLEDSVESSDQWERGKELRYLTGYATAVDSKGNCVQVTIDDIYKLAEQKLGGEMTRAEY